MEHTSWFEASLYSPAAKYLSNDGSFAQSQQPSPWQIEFIDGAPRNGGSIRLQAADGRFLRSDGGEGTPPSWTKEKCEETVWILLYSAGSDALTADMAVQLKSPTGGGGDIGGHPHPCLCNDTPTGGWGGSVKGMYSWCPEDRGDAFWNLHGLSTVKGLAPDWDRPIELTVHSNHAMHSNGPIQHILECHTSNFANFDGGRNEGLGGPWWVIFDAGKPQAVGGGEMAAFVAEESPKVVELLASDDLACWDLIATLNSAAPWGTDAGPKQWPVDKPHVARYWKINVTDTHNGVAPTIHYCKLVAPSSTAESLEESLSTLSAALSGGSSTRLAKLSATAMELVDKADAQAIEAAVEKLLSKEGPLTARFFIDDCARAPDRPRIVLALPRPFFMMSSLVYNASAAPISLCTGVTSCFYNGVDLKSKINTKQCKVTTLQLQYEPGAVLCVGGWDNQEGEAAGLFLAASTSRGPVKLCPGDGCELECRVLGADDNKPPEGWHENSFDDQSWEVPGSEKVWSGWSSHLPGEMKAMGVTGKDGIWNATKKYNFFRIRLDACACKVLDGIVLQPACAALLDALCEKQPSLRAAATTPDTLLLALSTPEHAACACKLLEPPYNAPISKDVRELLLKPSKLKQFLTNPQCVPLVKILLAKDAAIKDAATASEHLLQVLKPATSTMALVLLDNGADLSLARDALLSDGAKLLRSLVLDPKSSLLVDALCKRDAEIKAVVASSEMLVAALSPASAPVALWLITEYGVEITAAVTTALTEGEAAVTSTTALKFKKDIFLEDDGTALPLGNSDYTMEFWIRFDGQHGCFVGFGHEPNNGCNGCHFEGAHCHALPLLLLACAAARALTALARARVGHGFNHFWYANDLHPGDGGEQLTERWMHLGENLDLSSQLRVNLSLTRPTLRALGSSPW